MPTSATRALAKDEVEACVVMLAASLARASSTAGTIVRVAVATVPEMIAGAEEIARSDVDPPTMVGDVRIANADTRARTGAAIETIVVELSAARRGGALDAVPASKDARVPSIAERVDTRVGMIASSLENAGMDAGMTARRPVEADMDVVMIASILVTGATVAATDRDQGAAAIAGMIPVQGDGA
ncbi:hypothetical protein ACTQ49_12890 [Luteococcus sp. Sow4_B9]|uniref:hypothetical protein n=1 Tax=Luteococcus sp. Sow4_B9 TaxID=3438792 RepID=UPI003F983C32